MSWLLVLLTGPPPLLGLSRGKGDFGGLPLSTVEAGLRVPRATRGTVRERACGWGGGATQRLANLIRCGQAGRHSGCTVDSI